MSLSLLISGGGVIAALSIACSAPGKRFLGFIWEWVKKLLRKPHETGRRLITKFLEVEVRWGNFELEVRSNVAETCCEHSTSKVAPMVDSPAKQLPLAAGGPLPPAPRGVGPAGDSNATSAPTSGLSDEAVDFWQVS